MTIAGLATAACLLGATAVVLAPRLDTDGTPVGTTPVAGTAPAGTDATPAGPGSTAGLGARASRSAGPTGAAVTARPAGAVAKDTPASMSYLRDRYRVSPDDAARRLALQEQSGPLAARLAEEFPDAYAGMWLDQADGGVLTIAATRTDLLRSAVAGVPDAAHVRVVPVRHSLRQLTAAAGRLAGTLDATAGTDVIVDEQANGVVVLTGDVVDAADARLAAALGGAGVPAKARARLSGAAVPKACDPRYCAKAPMRGGIRLDVPRDDGTVGGCTSGFNVRSRSGESFVLTAGHCVVGGRHQQVDRTWHQFLGPKVPVGVESTSPVLAENAFPYDYAVIPYQPGALDRWAYPRRPGTNPVSLVNYWCVPDNPRCTDEQGSRDVAVTGYVAANAIQVGWIVCATGSAYTPKAGETYVDSGAGAGYIPGTRCGEITGRGSGGIDVRICARPGDSGGPLFTESDGRALGILSNGDPGQGPCTNPNEHNSYAPVSTVLDRVNSRTGGTLGFQLSTLGPLLSPIAP
ncbi:trypsin-like serine protease [Micromonospora sp. NPDC048909]|uniref:trypsin-like serine protease n=1 Tax=Micromonospora sp. NPDC048909 TaxID=3155643 RepID=UPI0033EDF15A